MIQDNAAFLRAVKGPIMMITVGALFALDNFTNLSFSRTWPLLLVVAGLLSLGRKSSCRTNPARGKFQYRAQWGPPQPPTPPPPPPPAASPSTAGPGSYRGSNYEGTPGAPPRPATAKASESRETRSADLGETK